MHFPEAIERISDVIRRHKPVRLRIPEYKPAAVFIPVFEKNSDAHLLLTLRTDTVEHHKGQVSFPGGAREPQDQDLAETALREMYEEVGIPQNLPTIIGQLDDLPTISDFLVTPYVGTIPHPYPARINPAEVAEILEVPLALFLRDTDFEIKFKDYNGRRYPVYYYHFKHIVVWGMTAFILNKFVDLVFDYNPAPESIRSKMGNA